MRAPSQPNPRREIRANNPDSWSTVCGWKYGFSRFHRAFSVASADNQCRKCFQIESEGREEPSPSPSSSDSSGSDSSSSSGSESS